MVQRLEQAQAVGTPESTGLPEIQPEVVTTQNNPGMELIPVPLRTSTPTSFDGENDAPANLSQLESALHLANVTSTELPELVPVLGTNQGHEDAPPLPPEEDNASSSCEFPELTRTIPRVHFLADFSEGEKTVDRASLSSCPSINGKIPVDIESGTEASDESDLHAGTSSANGPSTSAFKNTADDLLELSGRSRAILKTYFGKAKAFNLPQGHPTVALTEPQLYHLLRVMSDETLRMFYSTMEQMVLSAVKGKPAVAPSRTGPFRSQVRASTPFRDPGKDFSDSDSEQMTSANFDIPGLADQGESRQSSSFGESDSAGEMALIAESF